MTANALQQAQGYLSAGMPDRARDLLRAELATDPTNPAAHLLLGAAESELGNLTEAEQHARLTLTSAELAASGWLLLANVLQRIPERKEEFLAAATNAVRSDPNDWHGRQMLAIALHTADLPAAALAEAQHAVNLAVTNEYDRAQALMTLAKLELSAGYRHEARETVGQAMALAPTDIELQSSLVRMQLALGQRAKAIATALGVLRVTPTDVAPVNLSKIALFLIELRLVFSALIISFLVPLLTFGVLGMRAQRGEWIDDALTEAVIRGGGAVGVVALLLVASIQLRHLADASVRRAVLRFASRSVRTWIIGIMLIAMALCYLLTIVFGTAVILLPLPFGIMLVTWFFHTFAVHALRTDGI